MGDDHTNVTWGRAYMFHQLNQHFINVLTLVLVFYTKICVFDGRTLEINEISEVARSF